MSQSSPRSEKAGGAGHPAPHRIGGRLGRWAGAVFRLGALFGMACLFGAGLVTVIDILLRFAGAAIPGVVDIVQLLILAAAFAAIPFAFWRDGHVSVDLVTRAFPARLQALLALVTAAAGLGLMALILWYGWSSAQIQLRFGDVSQNLRIPMIWYWTPLLVGSAFSIAACLIGAIAALKALAAPAGRASGGG